MNKRFLYKVRTCCAFWSFCLVLLSALPGCAAQLKESGKLSRLGYAIQVGAFSDVKNAERLTEKLQQKGIEAFYFRKENGIYAVRFGDFATRDEAERATRRLRSERLISSYFIASPQKVTLRDREPSWKKVPEPSLAKSPTDDARKRDGEKPQRKEPVATSKGHADMGNIAARTAERFVGIPYRWGGDTVVDGMDCSGFARAVYNLCGVNIPRTSREQFRVGDPVDRGDLRDGDLVFFGASASEINHVGIFTGNGKFVHAPRRGDDIKVSEMDEAYFMKKFVGARRYF
ncbi:MAG: C40 family peptidase [Geobacter sp.]|nr:C40 family peptidase [Geobacter sp.]